MSENVVLEITGMHCTACAHVIELTLKEVEGVESVEVEYPAGLVNLQVDFSKTNVAALVNAINKLGYQAG